MLDRPKRYRFHVHKVATAWRLVTVAGTEPPGDLDFDAWTFTLERASADTNPDVRAICAAHGYCLFKIGGTLEDVARDVLARKKT